LSTVHFLAVYLSQTTQYSMSYRDHMAFHGRHHGLLCLHMEFSWSIWNPIAYYGNTMVFHGNCMAPWYSMEVFMGWHVQFSWSVCNPMELHVILRPPWHSMEEFMGLHVEFPWSTWYPIVFHGNTTVLHGDTMTPCYPLEIFMGLHVEFSWSTWNVMAFLGKTMVLHGNTMVPFVSHGSFHGYRYGVFMEYEMLWYFCWNTIAFNANCIGFP